METLLEGFAMTVEYFKSGGVITSPPETLTEDVVEAVRDVATELSIAILKARQD